MPKDIRILYENNDILVAIKPFGLLTIGTNREKSRTLYALLTEYASKGYSKSTKHAFTVHRLDRDTSAGYLFLQRAWRSNSDCRINGKKQKKDVLRS